MVKSLTRFLLSAAICAMGGTSACAGDAPAPWKMKPALLVIDIQNAFLPYMSDQDKKLSTLAINDAIQIFRSHGLPVIRVYHTDPQWGPKVDSKEFEFTPDIQIKAEDPKIIKNYPSAFKKTGLEKLLKEKGVNTLFLCGLSGTGCVLATYRGADDLDFKTFLVKDAVLSPKAEHTPMIQDICNSVGSETLFVMLDLLPK